MIQEEHSHTPEVKEKDKEMAELPDPKGCAQHAREPNAEGLPQTAPSLVVKAVSAGVFLDGVTCSYMFHLLV